jgi:hypothetical protein
MTGIDLLATVGCAYPNPRITYRRMGATEMDFPDGSFDACFSIATLEHITDPAVQAEWITVEDSPAGPPGDRAVIDPRADASSFRTLSRRRTRQIPASPRRLHLKECPEPASRWLNRWRLFPPLLVGPARFGPAANGL